MTNYSLITLGELLSSENETIKRNAVGILKALQKGRHSDITTPKSKWGVKQGNWEKVLPEDR